MTGWEVQEMWERDTAALWERLNEPDPAEKQMGEAAKELRLADIELSISEDLVAAAAEAVKGFPMEDVLLSFYDQLEELRFGLKMLGEKYERGERE